MGWLLGTVTGAIVASLLREPTFLQVVGIGGCCGGFGTMLGLAANRDR